VWKDELDVWKCLLDDGHAIHPALAGVAETVHEDDGANRRFLGLHDDGIPESLGRHGVAANV